MNTAVGANKTFGFLRRNLRHALPDLKENSYKALARPKVEYGGTGWDPHKAEDRCVFEKVQRRTACFATGRYQSQSSVLDILDQLGCGSLKQLTARATMA